MKALGQADEREYTVEFLVSVKVRVKTFDELQAEKHAYQKLSKKYRDKIVHYRVFEGDADKPMFDWANPDLDWMGDPPL